MTGEPNHSIQRMGANRSGEWQCERLRRNKNKCQSSLLTLPGRADKGLPCRASYALSTLGPCITS